MAFQTWLLERLNDAGLDGDVYGEYIEGALDSMKGSTNKEREEALLEILEGYMEDEQMCKNLCSEVLSAWEKQRKTEDSKESQQAAVACLQQAGPRSVGSSSSQGSHSQQHGASSGGLSAQEKKRLIAQYDCESDEEQMESLDLGVKEESGLFLNRNAAVVSDAGRQHREKLKVDHEARLEKIKLDKDKQKQKAQERKEKEKKRTQKQERRR